MASVRRMRRTTSIATRCPTAAMEPMEATEITIRIRPAIKELAKTGTRRLENRVHTDVMRPKGKASTS